MNKVVINGSRLGEQMDGMRRAEVEIIKRLDKKFKPGIAELIVKDGYKKNPIMDLQNIKVIERKFPKKYWEFFNVDLYANLNNALCIGFCNRAGYAKHGLYLLNDIIPIVFYDIKNKGLESKKYFSNLSRIKKYSRPIMTVSEFCKNQFIEYLGLDDKSIIVAKSGWEHILTLPEDEGIFKKYPNIKKGEYYFSLGSVSPHKNFKFIYELAKRNPCDKFVITGKILHGFDINIEDVPNMIYTGKLDDGEMKSLMKNCKAFIFPSFIEGFGLPPLEALACGVKVCVSDIPVMHEICKDSVHYFNPNDYSIKLDELLKQTVSPPGDALNELSWDKNAEIWYRFIMKNLSEDIK